MVRRDVFRSMRMLEVIALTYLLTHIIWSYVGKSRATSSKSQEAQHIYKPGYKLFEDGVGGNFSPSEYHQCTLDVQSKLQTLWQHQKDYTLQNQSDPCCDLWKSIEMERNVIIDFLGQETPWNQTAVTLVTQTSYGRIDHLLASIKMWEGPISVAVYVKDDNIDEIASKICGTKEFFTRKDIGLHFAPVQGKYYPYNYLRNMALNATRTSHVFLLDVDFGLMPGLHSRFLQYIKEGIPAHMEVLVIPAFEWSPISMLLQPAFPRDKQQLLQLWEQGMVFPFHLYRFYGGHGPTNFTRWRSVNETYSAEWAPQYEPYIMMRTAEAPRYWQKFVGPYRDKISQIQETHAKGYHFIVSYDNFIIHAPHPKMIDKNERKLLYSCATPVYEEFRTYIRNAYGVELLD